LIVSTDLVEKKLAKAIIHATALKEQMGLCQKTRYEEAPSLSGCTGFLVGEDLIATAGHCIENVDRCENMSIVFDVSEEQVVSQGYKVSQKNIYNCKKVIAQEMSDERDFALIQLDKKVSGRLPLKLNLKDNVSLGAKVFMLGHPLGLPMIYSRPGPVNVINDYSFKAQIDSFSGNSGSPVFDAKTLEVVGILVRGEEDFLKDEEKQCYVYQKYKTGIDLLRGEGISKIKEILPYLR
jgi:V8-like Glu-specific endopeptidase